ncbi:MAG: PsbP-related protein [Patescibacteria group bacterium]|nr:PsbP-related protein [Patescibacteria group bacterium]
MNCKITFVDKRGFATIPAILIVLALITVIGGYFAIFRKPALSPLITQKPPQLVEYKAPIKTVISPEGTKLTIFSQSSVIGEISLDNLPDLNISVNPTAKIINAWIVPYTMSVNMILNSEILFFVTAKNTVPSFWLVGLDGENARKILRVSLISGDISVVGGAPIFSPDGSKFVILLKSPSFYKNRAVICKDIQDIFGGDSISDDFVDIIGYDLMLRSSVFNNLPFPGSKDPTFLGIRVINAKWIDNNSLEFTNSPLQYPYVDTRALGWSSSICPDKLPVETYHLSPVFKNASDRPYFHSNFPKSLSNQDWQTYRDEQQGFLVQYPSAWKKIANSLTSGEIIRFNSEHYTDKRGDYWAMLKIYLLNDKKIKTVIEERLASAKQGFIKIDSSKNINLNSYQGIEFIYTNYNISPAGSQSIEYFIPKDKKLYQIQFTLSYVFSPPRENWLNVFDKILSTFKFIPSPSGKGQVGPYE